MDCWAQMRWKSCSQNRKALETTCVPLTGKWLVVSDMFTQWKRLRGSRKEWAPSTGASPKCQTHRRQAPDFILRRRGKLGSGHRRVRGCGTDQEGQTDSLPAGNLLCLVCRGGPEVHLSNDDFRSDHFVTCKMCQLRYTLILKGFQLWYQRQLVKFWPCHFSVQPWEGAFTSQPPVSLFSKWREWKHLRPRLTVTIHDTVA